MKPLLNLVQSTQDTIASEEEEESEEEDEMQGGCCQSCQFASFEGLPPPPQLACGIVLSLPLAALAAYQAAAGNFVGPTGGITAFSVFPALEV